MEGMHSQPSDSGFLNVRLAAMGFGKLGGRLVSNSRQAITDHLLDNVLEKRRVFIGV